jgi:hypothetical protein
MNLKQLLSCFEQMSGMGINFHKCDIVPINMEQVEAHLCAQTLSCRLGNLPTEIFGNTSPL